MRNILAVLLALIPSIALAFPAAPVLIGKNSAAAGANSLAITTTTACNWPGIVITGQAEFGSTTTQNTAPTDSVGNTYNSIGSGFSGTSLNGIVARTVRSTFVNLPASSTITLHFPNTTAAHHGIAICVPSGIVAYTDTSQDTNGTATSGSSGNPAITQSANLNVPDVTLVLTLVASGGSDTYTESTGYSTVASTLATDALYLSYAFSPTTSPPAYSATNNASRNWGENSYSFRGARCLLGSVGAGVC